MAACTCCFTECRDVHARLESGTRFIHGVRASLALHGNDLLGHIAKRGDVLRMLEREHHASVLVANRVMRNAPELVPESLAFHR